MIMINSGILYISSYNRFGLLKIHILPPKNEKIVENRLIKTKPEVIIIR